jgi:hypothetical protein
MPEQAGEKAELKMYSDFKSPYAYLAFDPGMTLGQRFDVRVRWIPFQLRVKGKGERSVYSEYKVKYSYIGCSALGETARSLDSRPLEGIRHHPCGDRRIIRRDAGSIARLWANGLQKILSSRVRSRSP